MASPDFFFAVEFSTQGAPAQLVDDLVDQVLRHVGCAVQAAPGLSDAVGKAVADDGAGKRRCDVQFRARNGALEILVSSNGGRVWQTSIDIP